MIMKKKCIVTAIIMIIVIALLIILKFLKKYDLSNSPSVYNLNTEYKKGKYINIISKEIYPEKLRNFLNVKRIPFSIVDEYNSGFDSISFFKYEAYTELFNQLFDKNRNDYEDCPVTNNFKSKFGNNLFEYFKLNDYNDSDVDCGISDKEKTLRVTEAGDFNLGEPGYIFYHHFHYVLDDEGNVDDVIFDYTE